MNHGRKVQALTLINHLVFLTGVWFTPNWYYVLAGFLMYLFVGLISANISMHRYISHKSFETTPYKDKFLKYVSILACFGSPISWAALHRHHHKYSDTERDIQNPKEIGALRSWSSLYPEVKISPRMVVDLMKDKDSKFIHQHYFKFIMALATVWFVIDPMLLVWCFSFPAIMSFHGASTIGVIPHYEWAGYKVANTDDDSVNSPIASLLSLGEGWHNYHHSNSSDYRHGHKWWELDPSAFIIEKIFKC
tara:strand:+ start:2876 stop:3622 length:747 start_codon:yes stop_codon:yes gene_type:complete